MGYITVQQYFYALLITFFLQHDQLFLWPIYHKTIAQAFFRGIYLCFSTSCMKSCECILPMPICKNAGFQKWNFRTLHEYLWIHPRWDKNLLAIFSARSITKTLLPRFPASIAHMSPAAPAPIMIVSYGILISLLISPVSSSRISSFPNTDVDIEKV